MKRIAAIALGASLIMSSGSAQEAEEDGFSLMEEGAKLFFEGIMREMEPALEELEGLARDMEPALREFAQEMGPALRGLLDDVEDWSSYHPPEMLPNGDIILRKKSPEELAEPAPDGEIEL
jgi:hypothetical protein